MLYLWEECDLAGAMAAGFDDRLIAEDCLTRSAPPVDVFCYPLVATWADPIWALISDVVTEDVKAAFVKTPPEYIVSDDLSWLNRRVMQVTGRQVEMKSLLADRMRKHYRAFRAGHATRTDDLRPFYEEGLKCLKASQVEDRTRALFLDGKYRWGTEDRLADAINHLDARNEGGGRESRLYFCADERNLMSRSGSAGHYLVYGSEYLYCLGMRVVGVDDTQKALKSIGRPTMLVCDIPMAQMQAYTLEDFAGSVLEYLFSSLVQGMECHALSPGAGSDLSLRNALEPQHIVGHYHPRAVHSPY